MSSAVRENDQVQVHADRNCSLRDHAKIGLIFRDVHGTAKQDQFPHCQSRVHLCRLHRHIPSVAVRDEVQSLFPTLIDPLHEVFTSEIPRGIAVTAAPSETVRLFVQIRTNILQNVGMGISSRTRESHLPKFLE